MKAKYATRCRTCGGNIRAGAEIEWKRGAGAQHVRCASAAKAGAAANERGWQTARYTATGRFSMGAIIADGENLYRVVTRGRRYHEDVGEAIYGVEPIEATPEWIATCRLRSAIDEVLKRGTHTPGSRHLIGTDRVGVCVPVQPVTAKWTYRCSAKSLASGDDLVVRGDVVEVLQPNYDDAASNAWLWDANLASVLTDAIALAPEPIYYTTARVSARRVA
ncbi:MAG TPA: hypothetical protein VNF68_15690 [Candidatus Baltobacteraceae bacterium]|nr:hypothetical protein [Candidatus Baltobacteraceae bacterium]